MTLPPMPIGRTSRFLQGYFAAAAARERAARENHYPDMVARGDVARDVAEADIAAWRVIEALFRDGTVETRLSWAELEHATAQALQRREAEVEKRPDDPRLIARRDAVWGIHERLSTHRARIMGTSTAAADRRAGNDRRMA